MFVLLRLYLNSVLFVFVLRMEMVIRVSCMTWIGSIYPWVTSISSSTKYNEMKWNISFLIKFTTNSGNTWKQNTRKLINYLIFMIKKYKESKIVKKCLRWINLLVVSGGKCSNGIKRENSTGSLWIINRTYLI